jgi:tetratricopeptide (TPR) repeat protein
MEVDTGFPDRCTLLLTCALAAAGGPWLAPPALAQDDAMRGLQLVAQGRCREAVDPLQRALQAGAGDCALRAGLGECLLTLGKTQRAERVLTEAATCDDAGALESAALAAWRHQRLEMASLLFERVVALDAERSEIHGYLAQIRFGAGQLDAAAAAARQALAVRPDDIQMRGLLALALARGEREEEAVPELRLYLETVPDDSGARVLLALLHVRLGQRREAVEELRHVVAEAPDTPGAASLLGAGLYDLGDLEEARAVLETALPADPESLGLTALALGRIYAHEGLYGRAAELLTTAAEELGADFPDGDLLAHVRRLTAGG